MCILISNIPSLLHLPPTLPNPPVYALIAASDHRGTGKGNAPVLLQLPSSCRGFEGSEPFPPSFFFFLFWEPDIKDSDIQKQLHICGKLESDHACTGKGTGSEKT